MREENNNKTGSHVEVVESSSLVELALASPLLSLERKAPKRTLQEQKKRRNCLLKRSLLPPSPPRPST